MLINFSFHQAALEHARKEWTNDMSQNVSRGKVCPPFGPVHTGAFSYRLHKSTLVHLRLKTDTFQALVTFSSFHFRCLH